MLLLLLLLVAGCGGLVPSAPPVPASAVVATLQVGDAPTLLAASPDGRRVYAASNGSITIIDAASNTVLQTLKDDPNSTGIAVAPDGARAYVAHLFSINLTAIDTAKDALLPSVVMFLQRLRGGFGRLVVAPDNRTVYIANKANEAFGIIDLGGGPGSLLKPTVWPVDVAISPDGRTVYGAGCKQICVPGFVQLYDVPSKRFTGEIQVDGNPYRIVLSPNGANAYVANLSGPNVSYVDLASRDVTATVAVPPQPTGMGISPDGATLYVASQTAGTLSVLDVATAAVRAQLPAYQARDVAVSPDGRHVYVSSGDKVLVLDATQL
ncbi:MAG TPA: YncE family protein [Candidatus Dormibacteraeota bacterium]|nr:YncE family protein [Candidatus Dormibacteraeota bacterium]